MRHFTLASLLATALTLGLLTATPSMAQTAQPATKSDSKMAPAPKASESKMAPAPKAELLDINSATADQLDALPGKTVEGKVFAVNPLVDAAGRAVVIRAMVRNPDTSLRPGMFARGEFQLGTGSALTLPQSAVLLRDGFSYVYRIEPDGKVMQVKVSIGRRSGELVEITGGVEPGARVVASGGAFLADGDSVRVVESQAKK